MGRKILYVDFDGVAGKFDIKSLLKKYSGLDKIKVLKIFVHMTGILKQSKQFKELINEYQAGKHTQDELITLIGKKYPSLDSISRDVLNSIPDTLVINNEMLDYLDKKIAEGYEVYVITNNMPENIDAIQNTMNGHCNGIFFTTEIGQRKDTTETFKLINETLEVKPGEVKMFLDDKSKYVDIATKCGLPSMVFNKKDKKIYDKIDASLERALPQVER